MTSTFRGLHALEITAWIFGGFIVLLFGSPAARAEDDVTAVYSKVVSEDYIRTKLADGSYKPEEYFLKNGGRYDQPSGDASIDEKSYSDITRVIGGQLRTQNFRPANGLKTGKLIILVFWGTTTPPERDTEHALERPYDHYVTMNGVKVITGGPVGSASAMSQLDFENFAHLHIDGKNAGLLGYDLAMNHEAPAMIGLFPKDQELLNELEGERYFVVLMAYDSRAFFLQKRYKELWETRFSLSTRNTDFTKALPKMAKDASNFFGRDSHGLQHLQNGKVNIGEVKSLGEVEPPQK
jgi:hypothetical protein